jgi:hypothetical protein
MRKLTAVAIGMVCFLAWTASTASSATGNNQQRWTVVTTPGSPTAVYAQGALNAKGTVVDVLTLFPNGTFDNLATQNFPDGQLLYHGQGTYEISVNTRLCRGEGDVFGPFVITGGTGAYTGATGSGVAIIHLTFLFDRTPTGCAPFPSKVWGVAHASGTLNLP